MTRSDFADLLIERVPETRPTLREHLDDNFGELLLHLLVADLRRLAFAWFEKAEMEPMLRLLEVIDAGLGEGDEDVVNAVAVSFVEDTCWWEASSQAFISTWPTRLIDEVERQRKAGA